MVGALIAVGIWVLVLLVWWAGQRLQRPPVVTVQAPSPVVVPAPNVTVYPRRREPGPMIEIRLKSGSLTRELGVYRCLAEQRTPTLVVRVTDGTKSLFSASHQEGEQWVYRRVGVERES